MKIRLGEEEFWPYMLRSSSGTFYNIPRKVWEAHEKARTAFEKAHKELMLHINKRETRI